MDLRLKHDLSLRLGAMLAASIMVKYNGISTSASKTSPGWVDFR